jgi:hypothetical protein
VRPQAYDGDAATNELRSGPAAARLAAAAALKAAGNAALQAAPGGAPAAEQALQQYTKALSLLRYFGARLSDETAATSPDHARLTPMMRAAKASGASDEERVRCASLELPSRQGG